MNGPHMLVFCKKLQTMNIARAHIHQCWTLKAPLFPKNVSFLQKLQTMNIARAPHIYQFGTLKALLFPTYVSFLQKLRTLTLPLTIFINVVP